MENMILDLSQVSLKNLDVNRNTIKYKGKGATINDVGAIRSNVPFAKDCIVGYFEIYIESAGTRGTMSIGVSSEEFSGCKYPGYDLDSFGYMGEDGRKFFDRGRGSEYGPSYTTGDYVGCGVHIRSQEVFFTKNGKWLGFAFTKMPVGSYFPTVGLHSTGEIVTVNLGSSPFKFEITPYIEEEKRKIIAQANSPSIDMSVVNDIVKEYLLYYGYENTLKTITSKSLNSPEKLQELDSLGKRKGIRDAVLRGDMRLAIQMTKDFFPGILEGTDEKYCKELFLCKCQEFIELIKKVDVDRSVTFLQTELSVFYKNPSKYDQQFLQDVVALIAYEDPLSCPSSHLLAQKQREVVADSLNDAILNYGKEEKSYKASSLDFLMRQLILSSRFLVDENYQPREVEGECSLDPSQILFNL